MKIIGYLKKTKLTVLIVILLLVVQAACDLKLPTYTSNIVDVGIQQGGISNAVPTQIRAETLEKLEMLMEDSGIETVYAFYSAQDDGTYKLNTSDKEAISLLDSILGMPIVTLMGIEESSMFDFDQLRDALDTGMMTKEQLLTMIRENTPEFVANLSNSLISQSAAQFIKAEYQAIGVDTDKIQTKYLFSTGLKMLGITLISMLSAIAGALLASRAAAKIAMDLRGSLFKRVVSFSNKEIDKFSTASLITRSTNDIQQVQMTLFMVLRLVFYAPIVGVGGVLKVYNTHTGMGWIILAAVGLMGTLVGILMIIAMPKFKIMQSLIDKMNLVSREILTGIPVIRAFSREKHEEKRFDGASRDLMRTQLFTNRVMTFMMPVMMILMNAISIMIIWFGAKGIDLGKLQVGDMMAFINYTMMIIMAFMMFTVMSIILPRANVAAGRINEVIATESDIMDKEIPLDDKLSDIKGILSFNNVSFRYPGAEYNVLEHISFTAHPGKTTAIIGSTGSGKSTLISLITRFYDVSGGSITLDGIDIRDISQKKLRSCLGYVPQKGILFSGDIESNIKFAGADISDDAMFEAAKVAQAWDFIEQKSEKFSDPISQGGTNVSGGQKQRLSIARAIAKDPKIYLFDDSFSALDYKTDVKLRRALGEHVKNATVIIVAQRISTVLHADQIIVLEEGKIAGIGTHDELIYDCEAYKEIAKSQLSEKELGIEGGDAQ